MGDMRRRCAVGATKEAMTKDDKTLHEALIELRDTWRELCDTVRDVLFDIEPHLYAAWLVCIVLFALCVLWYAMAGVCR